MTSPALSTSPAFPASSTAARTDLPPEDARAFLHAAVAGLTRTPKTVPGTYLWDEAGSVLFARIGEHPDYYPTRHEMGLLPRVAGEIADLIGGGATVVEFGSGANRKIRTLLDTLVRPVRVVSIDISRDYLEASAARLAADYPAVEVVPVCLDYGRAFTLPMDLGSGPILGFFPGTSIGNASPSEAEAVLGRVRTALGRGHLLIGADPTQDEARLRRAYGGCDGLMAAFHLNLLARMNRELASDFDLDAFRHEVRLPADPFRVEAHLVASRAVRYRLGGAEIAFAAGESLRTDTSHKYRPDAFLRLAQRAGWRIERTWLDDAGAFALYLLAT